MKRILLFLILFYFNSLSFAQITLKENILPDTYGNERSPGVLASKLTEGLSDEKDKFDVIYTWVVKNIRYDYKYSLTTNGYRKSDVNRILRRKKGICIDYAFLMDTLCELAGITNVTVNGYAKDDLFDVNDSIYFDNHSWNAVRINARWYVYDATFAVGSYIPKYTRFSSFIKKLIEKLSEKTKTKILKYSTSKKVECEKRIKKDKKYTREYQQIAFLNRIFIKILSLKRLRYRLVFDKIVNNDYYLTEPELFSLTHTPNNSIWSLNTKYKSMQEVESDSAYYYINDSIYTNQARAGRLCFDCDKFISFDDLEKPQFTKMKSNIFNLKNKYVSWECDYDISDYYYKQSIIFEDSLTKTRMLDSSLTYLTFSRKDLSESLKSSKKEIKFHLDKNKNKTNLLRKDNVIHTKLIKTLRSSTFKRLRKIKKIEIKNKTTVINYKNQIKKIKKTKIEIPKRNIKLAKNDSLLIVELKNSISKSDSINSSLNSLSSSYELNTNSLSDNLWSKINSRNKFQHQFYNGGFYRSFYLLDAYKKQIKDHRKFIQKEEKKYISSITDSILTITDSCYNLYLKIIDLTKNRNNQFLKTIKIMNKLIKQELIKSDSLQSFINFKKDEIKERECWIINGTDKLKAINEGFRILEKQQKRILKSINYENRCENYRNGTINKKIKNQYTKHNNVVRQNMKLTTKKRELVYKTKKNYLDKLKIEAKKIKKI